MNLPTGAKLIVYAKTSYVVVICNKSNPREIDNDRYTISHPKMFERSSKIENTKEKVKNKIYNAKKQQKHFKLSSKSKHRTKQMLC